MRFPFASLNAFQSHSVLGSDSLVLLLGQKKNKNFTLCTFSCFIWFVWGKFSILFAVMIQNRKAVNSDWLRTLLTQNFVGVSSFLLVQWGEKYLGRFFFPCYFCITFLLTGTKYDNVFVFNLFWVAFYLKLFTWIALTLLITSCLLIIACPC